MSVTRKDNVKSFFELSIMPKIGCINDTKYILHTTRFGLNSVHSTARYFCLICIPSIKNIFCYHTVYKDWIPYPCITNENNVICPIYKYPIRKYTTYGMKIEAKTFSNSYMSKFRAVSPSFLCDKR